MWGIVIFTYIVWIVLITTNNLSPLEMFEGYIITLVIAIIPLIFIYYKIDNNTPIKKYGIYLIVGSILTFLIFLLYSIFFSGPVIRLFLKSIPPIYQSGVEGLDGAVFAVVICFTYFLIGVLTYIIGKFVKSDNNTTITKK